MGRPSFLRVHSHRATSCRTLLLLVEAFAGPGWRQLYATALAEGYRFLSFGDAMVVARAGAKGTPMDFVADLPADPDPGDGGCRR